MTFNGKISNTDFDNIILNVNVNLRRFCASIINYILCACFQNTKIVQKIPKVPKKIS